MHNEDVLVSTVETIMVQVLPVGWMVSLGLLQFLLVYVAANEPIDPICQSSSEYLDAMYRCRPSKSLF